MTTNELVRLGCSCSDDTLGVTPRERKQAMWWAVAPHLSTLMNISFDPARMKDAAWISRLLPHPWPLLIKSRRSTTTAWTTPPEFTAAVLAGLRREKFDLDPASPEVPSVPCRNWFTVHDNGLVLGWNGEYVWCNPPYERLAPWVKKAISEYKSGRAKRVVMLIPNRPGTVYWRRMVESGAAMFALHGRLHFGGAPDPAPFACALIVWGLDEPELTALVACLPPHLRMRFE